jgi:hypothetical protein
MSMARGSSRFLTVAVVIFEAADAAHSCQVAIEGLRDRLRMAPRAEFHFHSDSHQRRLAFLDCIRHEGFSVVAFSVDKARVSRTDLEQQGGLYASACAMALTNCSGLLSDARVVVDSLTNRHLKRELTTFLRRSGPEDRGIPMVKEVALKRSHGDPLVQVADYCAGVVYRSLEGKRGADEYLRRLERRIVRNVVWPQA